LLILTWEKPQSKLDELDGLINITSNMFERKEGKRENEKEEMS
jgi:hypothetical protein